jgi:hypothetical protein
MGNSFYAAETFIQELKTLVHGAPHWPALTGVKGDLRTAPAVNCSLADCPLPELGMALCNMTCVLQNYLSLH